MFVFFQIIHSGKIQFLQICRHKEKLNIVCIDREQIIVLFSIHINLTKPIFRCLMFKFYKNETQ